MSRSFSQVAEPHRDLFLSDDALRGADIRALIHAADARLDARNVHRGWSGAGDHDGILTSHSDFDSLVTAARLLGAMEDTLAKKDAKGRPVLTVGAQQMIRYPGRRTPVQLQRAEDRLAALIIDREKRERASAAGDVGGVAGLSPAQRSAARAHAVANMRLLLAHAPLVHYTQGPQRWQGIAQHLNPAAGHFPNYADCSSSTTWALYYAFLHAAGHAVPDVVNGSGWGGGYTGTQLVHGQVVARGSWMPGDLLFYGVPGTTGKHVAMFTGPFVFNGVRGNAISHGSEAAPFLVWVDYRPDYMGARRYI